MSAIALRPGRSLNGGNGATCDGPAARLSDRYSLSEPTVVRASRSGADAPKAAIHAEREIPPLSARFVEPFSLMGELSGPS